MTREEYHAQAAAAMTERVLQRDVMHLARAFHWWAYHTWISARSQPGFPDLVLVSAQQQRVLYRELKRQSGQLTPAQRAWLDELAAAGADTGIWRPLDLVEGRIEADLRGHPISASTPPTTEGDTPT